MKTEPIEALEEIKHCSWETGNFKISSGFESYEVIDEDDAINIANIAFREGQSSPRIKQLEWKETDYYIEARTIICKYLTLSSGAKLEHESIVQMYFGGTGEIIFNGPLNEAKTTAQTDFERRVKECLDL